MGKMKIGIYCFLIADILKKFYRNIPWVILYHFCFNLLIWLVTMATKIYEKNIQKSTPQKLYGG